MSLGDVHVQHGRENTYPRWHGLGKMFVGCVWLVVFRLLEARYAPPISSHHAAPCGGLCCVALQVKMEAGSSPEVLDAINRKITTLK